MSNAINLQPAYRSIIYSTTSSGSKAKGAPASGVLHILYTAFFNFRFRVYMFDSVCACVSI